MALYGRGVLKSSKSLVGLPCWLIGKECPCQCRTHSFPPTDREAPLEKGMAARSSILAWEILWTAVRGVTQSGA